MRLLRPALFAALLLSPVWALAERIEFKTPGTSCRIEYRTKKNKTWKRLPRDLPTNLRAVGKPMGSSSLLFKVAGRQFRNVYFRGDRTCILSQDLGSEDLSQTNWTQRTRKKGLYLSFFSGLLFQEFVSLDQVNGEESDILGSTAYGAGLGAGYALNLGQFSFSPEIGFFGNRTYTKNITTAIANTYNGYAAGYGAYLKLGAHFNFALSGSNYFGAGLSFPMMFRWGYYLSNDEAAVSNKNPRSLFGAGLSLFYGFGRWRVALEGGSVAFKKRAYGHLGAEFNF